MSKALALKLRDKLKRELQVIRTIDVLKQIAISEFQFLEAQRKAAGSFTSEMEKFFQFYKSKNIQDYGLYQSPSFDPALVAVTSDEGFAGAINNQILNEIVRLQRTYAGAQVVVIGRRGARNLTDMGIKVHREFPGITLPLDYKQVLPLKNYLMREYLKGNIGMAEIVYAKCESFTRQTLMTDELLPFSNAVFDRVEDNPLIMAGMVILEPDAKAIVEYTIGLWFSRKLYEIFWDSKLSETAARAIELNERSEKLSKTSEQTRMRHFRAAHEVVDEGIREVFAGQFFAKKLKKNAEEAEKGMNG